MSHPATPLPSLLGGTPLTAAGKWATSHIIGTVTDDEARELVCRIDGLLAAIEAARLEGVMRELPRELREELAALMALCGCGGRTPRYSVKAHELAMDLQQPLLLQLAQRHRRWAAVSSPETA